MSEFNEGDHVLYYPTGAENNPTSGVILKVIHEREQVGSQLVQASEEMPRYVIKNDKTQKETAYKLESIIDKVEGGGAAGGMEEGGEEEEEEVEEGKFGEETMEEEPMVREEEGARPSRLQAEEGIRKAGDIESEYLSESVP